MSGATFISVAVSCWTRFLVSWQAAHEDIGNKGELLVQAADVIVFCRLLPSVCERYLCIAEFKLKLNFVSPKSQSLITLTDAGKPSRCQRIQSETVGARRARASSIVIPTCFTSSLG
jgi:hypothetical protein